MRQMTKGNITKHLLAYAIPLIIGNILQLSYNAVDSIIIGRAAGESALAAVGAANPVMNVIILGVSGISIGASVLMSQFYGAGELKKLKQEAATTILFGAVASFVIFLIGFLFSSPILAMLHVPEEILPMAEDYLKIIFFGFLFTFQYNIMSAALRSIGDAKTPVKFLGLASALNVLLDLLFICVFHMGVAGAGLATVIAEGVSAVLCFVYVYRHIPALRLAKEDLKVDKELLKLTLESGSVTALQQTCQPIGKVLIQGVINSQGISAIAAFNAVSKVDDFAFIPEQSISHGMMTCIAQNKGSNQEDRVKETLQKGLKIEFCYWIIICTITLLLRRPLVMLFASKKGSQMVEYGISYLTLMAFFYVLPSFTNGMQGYFRGIGHMKATLIGTLIQISIRVIVIWIAVPIIGLNGAAYGCLFGWLCMIAFQVVYYKKKACL